MNTVADRLDMTKTLKFMRAAMIWGGFAFIVWYGYRLVQSESLKYLDWSPEMYGRFWPNRNLLAVHVATATVALVIAPVQFIDKVRMKWPRFHRVTGWTYAVCCLISAPVAVWLSSYSSCINCIVPFYIWGILTFMATAIALYMAVQRKLAVHRQFMIRSYVLMNGFVFVRLDWILPYPLPTGPGADREAMIIWLAWVVPLLITEMFLSWSPAVGKRRVARAQASG